MTKHARKEPQKCREIIQCVSYVRALYDFDAVKKDDLSFRKGDRMELEESSKSCDWWFAKHVKTGKTGYIPSNYVSKDDNSPQAQDFGMAAVIRKVILTTKAPKAVGPYSQAVVVDKTIYVSGQIGMIPETMEVVSGGAAAETEQALKNIGQILEAAGSSFDKVVKTTVLLDDIQNYKSVNDVYAKFFQKAFPARVAYQAAALPKGAKVEIDAIAIAGAVTDQLSE